MELHEPVIMCLDADNSVRWPTYPSCLSRPYYVASGESCLVERGPALYGLRAVASRQPPPLVLQCFQHQLIAAGIRAVASNGGDGPCLRSKYFLCTLCLL